MTPEEKNIEMWRIKKLIKTLENAKGKTIPFIPSWLEMARL